MLSNDGYFIIRHDATALVVALGLCLLACLVLVDLFAHAVATRGRSRAVWLGLSGFTGGTGIWATHFFAMQGFVTGLRSGFDLALMGAALLIAVAAASLGLALAAMAPGRWSALAGGAVIGIGVALMHACGMAAYQVAGDVERDGRLLALAVAIGIAVSAAAVRIGRGGGLGSRLGFAALLTAGICGHHALAIAALRIGLDPGATVSPGALAPQNLVGPVAAANGAILFLAVVALLTDLGVRRRAAAERLRMTSMADAAVEGLVICDGDVVVTANTSFSLLSGYASADVAGLRLPAVLPEAAGRDQWPRRGGTPAETTLVTRSGEVVPVEVLVNDVQFAGKRHQVVALRDLGARKRAEESIRFLAHHDALTGLPNRAMFEGRVEEALSAARRRGQRLAMVCLDLDRFKEINDLFGHEVGDDVLRGVGRVLAERFQGPRIAARLGGDEFAVLLPDVDQPAAVQVIAAELIRAFAGLATGRVSAPPVATSLGIAFFPDDAGDRRQLMTAADTALYRAKAEGRGVHRFYEAGMGEDVRGRRLIEHDLRSAVARGEFSLLYQPQLETRSGAIVGFEALLRWRHPERGAVSPAVFIPIAEESGIILQIGDWVLRTACAEAASWPKPLRIAVNVSAVQLHTPGFAEGVEAVLVETGIDPRRLELEITETALIRDMPRALAALRRVKAFGVKIAMDDFGTGYSSLSNLRAFPFDRIKIDGSFVHAVDVNQEAAAIVRAILELGRGLHLSILAEGVETQAELGFLGEELCDEVQGYLIGRPGPIAAFEAATHGPTAAVLAA
jgi:diguanylate cyclase (GGDEF)-like protein/PAS domain S-box-containing protein